MTTRPLLLLVDDEPAITGQLGPFLERAGFAVSVATDGAQAIAQAESLRPTLIVLDVMMPHMDGREALRRLRRAGDWTPVILLTQVGDAAERVMALEEGADDYLNKPFDPHELAARIKALLRRAGTGRPSLASAQQLASGTLRLNRASRRAFLAAAELALTHKALALLEYFMTHPDEVLTRERLLDAVWGWDYPVGTRAVDTRVAELRRALAEDADSPRFIETVAGAGYRFVGAVEVLA
jgi:DNA-binding response OmpR family regulator